MTGTHIIIDVSNILDNEKLKYSTSIFPIMDKIIEQFQLKVVAKASHQFDPFGFTGVYVLSKELYEMMKNEFGEECEIKLNVIKRN